MATRHLSDELPGLLTGDATRDVVLEAADHLRTCVDCQQELVWTVVAHASLTSAHRFAPEIVTEPDRPDETDLATDDDRPLPDLTELFTTARAEAGSEKSAPTRTERPRRALLAVAAAAVVLVGGGVTWAVAGSGDGTAPSGTTVALQNVVDGADAKAVVDGERMKLDAASLPRLTGGRQYEVWLADRATTTRQSIGFLKQDRSADISVPRSLMSRYNTIAISVQREGQTEFSGNVVLRGTYG